jgi:protein gp37
MSDLFHEKVPQEFVLRVWKVMEATPHHTYQILTKRPDRMATVLTSPGFVVLSNVWLGTSVEDGRVLHRIDELRAAPAAIRFISFEPLIGSVADGNLSGIHWAIVGGESGPQARPMDPVWIDEIFDLCTDADAAFFFKQWGGRNKKASGRTYRGRLWDDLPELRM